MYKYDAENRMIAVDNGVTATYEYDALGRRVQANTRDYLYDLDNHPITSFVGGVCCNRDEIYIAGRHLATYDIPNNTTYFHHADWLGTERLRTRYDGGYYQWMTSLPFGDSQTTSYACSGGTSDPQPCLVHRSRT